MIAYLAPEDFISDLLHEIPDQQAVHGRLVIAGGQIQSPIWAQNVWLSPKIITIGSIGDAVRLLKGIQRNWVGYFHSHHRRGQLIQDGLPPIRFKPLSFLERSPTAKLGSFSLLDANTLIYSEDSSSPFPHGEVVFVEDKISPPSRAYLKLWELFTVEENRPKAGSRCLDLGSSPGGWTWVLSQLGCEVISVDKAALDPRVSRAPNVRFMQKSAFALNPAEIGPVDWLFSDIICYPDRLFRLIEAWLSSGLVKNFVCTLKFQGPTDFAAIERFKSIPGGKLRHLFHNKHELTWTKV